MAELKAAYLIHGDDHGGVAERRASLRALIEAGAGGASSVELLEGDAATPAGVAGALAARTLPLAGAEPAGAARVILVEGVERWREADVEKHLLPAMSQMPPGTTLALFAREDSRAKAPPAVAKAVEHAGGQVVAQMTVKPWHLVKWTREQAARLGLELDAEAAKALVELVGERQQRLLRELEKLAVARAGAAGAGGGAGASAGASGGSPEPARVDAEEIRAGAARSAELRAYALADALVGGEARQATLAYLRLRGQGERLSGFTYLMAQRLRDALAIALRLNAGDKPAEIKRGLRMPSRAADRLLADVAKSDPDRLRRALRELAELELDSRGGAPVRWSVSLAEHSELALRSSALSEDTLAVRAIEAMSAPEPD
jgi:DNA polymerase-3 subunit delta